MKWRTAATRKWRRRGAYSRALRCAFPRFASLGRTVGAVTVMTMAIQGSAEGGEAMDEAVSEAQYEVLEEEEAAEIEDAIESAVDTGC